MTGQPRWRLSLKVGLALFFVVAGALAIVYLAVVPRLENRLVAAKTEELEQASSAVVAQLRRANAFQYTEIATFFAQNLNARVVVYARLSEDSLLAIADSSGLGSRDVRRDQVALRVAETGGPASGRVRRGAGERAEVAVPVDESTIVLLSAPLRDALANVQLVERTLLLAGGAALLVSWLVGYLVAARFTRRIQQLEEAAGRIAGGDFDYAIVDPRDDEVGQLARTFDSMRLRLAQLDHARREFIANASHELRTPLFSLAGFLELLQDEDLTRRERADFSAEMRAQVDRLTRLATDLLDLSRLDAGRLAVERREIDLSGTVHTVCEEFRAVADASGHVLATGEVTPARAVGDDQRVLQIARILVENALRHTPAGTRVAVSSGTRDGQARLAVRDGGPGIAAEEQDQLFERFYRADGGKASGSGLGLAIARELAERMDGTIEVDSRPGETVFTLVLRAAATEDAFPRENGAKERSLPSQV